ncbi:hypothetical protein PUNSTDRAFT_104658 [Punctularia strigosozonata HHB-11173 SS5]|uniref:uncharacterized protein n=1 Tax=Punctularia strigosozonata (strain HHB-11173) TaxID=741275 RepID=UPI00044179B2|nr:uncharacterized protein PUNSTDRAFT_104658 [Punctularia strigosozonata HHB-11173 SS5]EIN07141.1 hypothetical protein PUNSTDRAFT_104658 [Punctularia strigosozonata HHB-11173 SS5]
MGGKQPKSTPPTRHARLPLEDHPSTRRLSSSPDFTFIISSAPGPNLRHCNNRRSMTFIPRPFPPPALVGVPLEYIKVQLHELAPQYWASPDTADCTIVVPIPLKQADTPDAPLFPPGTLGSARRAAAHDPSGTGRRATEPSMPFAPRILMRLHVDYLSAHSPFFRALFSGTLPMDLLSSRSPSSCQSQSKLSPRLISSSTTQISVFIPVPDASSFRVLIHWIYFGQTQLLAECLARGVVSWEGVARNVEYLQLGNEIRSFLGGWWATYLRPGALELKADSDDEELEDVVSGSESEAGSEFSTTESDDDDDDDDAEFYANACRSQDDRISPRGRQRTRSP